MLNTVISDDESWKMSDPGMHNQRAVFKWPSTGIFLDK